MEINIYQICIINHRAIIQYAGYIESTVFDPEKLWNICNWSNYTDIKPSNLHADISSCSHDIIFENPATHVYHTAKSFGWEIFKSMKEVQDYINMFYRPEIMM